MTRYDVKRLALILAKQADIEGMKAENKQLEALGVTMAYTYEDYVYIKTNEVQHHPALSFFEKDHPYRDPGCGKIIIKSE